MTETQFKHICHCTNCGNEAEMVVTCELAEKPKPSAPPTVVPQKEGKTKGHAVCTHCGGEADIWLDE